MTDSDARAIGRLEGKIDLMLAEQQAAAQSRKQTYEKLETLDKKIEATDVKVAAIDRRLESVGEPVAEFSRWRERGIGAIMLISFVAASIGGIVTAAWGKIVAWFAGTG